MTDLAYTCTPCAQPFTGLEELADHIAHAHTPCTLEDELESERRHALNLPDEDEDDDDDEAEDELLPSRPLEAARRMEALRAHAAVAIAERNNVALEALRDELERVETHWQLCAEQLARQSQEATKTRRLIEWVLQEGCEVTR